MPERNVASQPNQGLADGLACLQELASSAEPVGCRELARRLGLHHVKVNRMLKGLVAAGMARQDAHSRYLCGPALHVLGALATFGSGLLGRALPHLQALVRDSGARVALGVRWRDRVCYLFHGDAATPAHEALGRTALEAVRRSSIGMVLLAQEPDATIAALADDGDTLLQDCRRIRKRGHARLRHGSRARPHLSVAVAVGEPAFAGLACTGIAPDTGLADMLALLHSTAAAIAGTEHA